MGNDSIIAEVGAALHNVSSSLNTLQSITAALDTISTLGVRISKDIEEIKEKRDQVKQIEGELEASMSIVERRMKELDEREGNLRKMEFELKEKGKRLGKWEEELEERQRKWNTIEMDTEEKQDIEATAEAREKIRSFIDKTPDQIRLNVRGAPFFVSKNTVMRHPRSLLAVMVKEGRFQDNKDVNIDRDPSNFYQLIKYMDGSRRIFKLPPQHAQQARNEVKYWLGLFFTHEPQLLSPYFSVLSEWLFSHSFSLLYKSSRDGISIKTFHERCDDKGPTLCIIQSQEGFLFGGYNADEWSSPKERTTQSNPSSFLFTLSNPHNIPSTKYHLKEGMISTQQDPQRGIAFGSHDSRSPYGLTLDHDYELITYWTDSYNDTTGKGYETFTGKSQKNSIKELLIFSVQ